MGIGLTRKQNGHLKWNYKCVLDHIVVNNVNKCAFV